MRRYSLDWKDKSVELGPGVSRIVRDLISAGNASEFLKSMVHSQLSYLNAVGVSLQTIDDDGFLTMRHQYGFSGPDFVTGARRNLWSKSANTEAIRKNSILIYQSAAEYVADFPELRGLYDFAQLAIVPVWVRGLPIGSLSLAFNFEFGPIPDERDDLWAVYQLLGMVLLSPPSWLYSLPQEIGVPPQNPEAIASEAELSTAEVGVLNLLAQGMSNKEISAALRYSTSYVGKVNMTLFEKLGVQKRRDAVRVAIAKGLVEK